jgi:peptidoglycan/LPS O-acetylase OafA/YrhL
MVISPVLARDRDRPLVVPTTAAGIRSGRNSALDFTKGILVLFMVLYHWLNYFVSTEGSVYTYLRFLTPSFIFITGFLIANVYHAKFARDRWRVFWRLTERGVKLLLLFTLLNVALNVLFASNYKGAMPGVTGFVRNAASIYISGNGKASFEVLVPISYLLLLAPWLFLLGGLYTRTVIVLCAAMFVGIAYADSLSPGSANLTLLATGVLGMVFGSHTIEAVNSWTNHWYAVVCLNIAYTIAIGILGVGYLLQPIGACLTVTLIYLIGMKTARSERIQRPIILLGKYSLFAYVAQICLLQLLRRALPYLDLHGLAFSLVSFAAAFALTVVTVESVDYVRTRSQTLDSLYRFVFA